MKPELMIRLFFLLGLLTIFAAVPYVISKIKRVFRYVNIKKLKAEGIKITVDLKKCSFSENARKQEVGTVYKEIIDRLFLKKSHGNCENVFVETYVHYECVFKNKKCQFVSKKINADSLSLKFLFDIHKESVIFIDKKNTHNYYFDLEFVEIKR